MSLRHAGHLCIAHELLKLCKHIKGPVAFVRGEERRSIFLCASSSFPLPLFLFYFLTDQLFLPFLQTDLGVVQFSHSTFYQQDSSCAVEGCKFYRGPPVGQPPRPPSMDTSRAHVASGVQDQPAAAAASVPAAQPRRFDVANHHTTTHK